MSMSRSQCWCAAALAACLVIPSVFVTTSHAETGAESAPTAWQLVDDGEPDHGSLTLVHDPETGRTFGFHGTGEGSQTIVWQLEENGWRRVFGDTPTATGVWRCAAWDERRGTAVVLGGESPATWEFDGANWTEISTANSPPHRSQCHMTYDSVRGRVVLFGGRKASDSTAIGGTWEYDGTDWQEISTPTQPLPRYDAGLAFDPVRGVTVLFGGLLDSVGYLRDTWEFDGAAWRQVSTSGPPPSARRGGMLTWNPLRGEIILFGGVSDSQYMADTHHWNGTRWVRDNPATSPDPRFDLTMVFDSSRGRIVGYGGHYDNYAYADSWEFDGNTWSLIEVPEHPAPRRGHILTYDADLDALVLFGGTNDSSTWQLSDTWHFADGRWQKPTNDPGAPDLSYGASMLYEASRGRVVGFGGSGFSTKIHEYAGDPRAWASLTQNGPYGRIDHGWAAFPPREGMLLFGGWADTPWGARCVHDTWILEGSAWTEVVTTHHPSERRGTAMTFCADDNSVYLYGGKEVRVRGTTHSDLWRFDGLDWTLVHDQAPPGPREYHSLSYDSARERLVVFGGGTSNEGRVWEFDGESWHAMPQTRQPETHRTSGTLAYHPELQVTFFFGGKTVLTTQTFGDLWAYGPDPDGDGIVGLLDNCVDTANADQANADDDAAGTACDCNDGDATLLRIPAPVTGLHWATDATTLSWDDARAGAGSASVHDVVRGALAALPVGSSAQESCLAHGASEASASDAEEPGAGTGFWYLVRARNACGVGSFGAASAGSMRESGACAAN